MGGIHWWQVDSPHKGPVTRKLFPFNDVIMRRPNGSYSTWVSKCTIWLWSSNASQVRFIVKWLPFLIHLFIYCLWECPSLTTHRKGGLKTRHFITLWPLLVPPFSNVSAIGCLYTRVQKILWFFFHPCQLFKFNFLEHHTHFTFIIVLCNSSDIWMSTLTHCAWVGIKVAPESKCETFPLIWHHALKPKRMVNC